MKIKKNDLFSFALTAFVISADQVSKFLAVTYMEPYSVFRSFFGDFLILRLVYNTGAAFSIGAGLGTVLRWSVLGILPLAFLIVLSIAYFKPNYFTGLQRWFICGIIGGGFGNLLDRFFRSNGVVDFIDVKFYGILGMERWPTFNIADASIVCCGIGLAVTFILQAVQKGDAKK